MFPLNKMLNTGSVLYLQIYKNRGFKRELGSEMLIALKTIAIDVVYGNEEQFTQNLGQPKLFSIITMLMITISHFQIG